MSRAATPPSPAFLLAGVPELPPAPLALRAGPLALAFADGGLRYVSRDGREILRRVHAAVRDRNWGTVPASIDIVEQSIGTDAFRLVFDARHRAGDIAFDWRGEITGDEQGTLRFTFDGTARSSFMRNRIGIVVLHPIEAAGVRARARYTNGTTWESTFPTRVAPEQPVSGLHDLAALAHEYAPECWAEVQFEGDEFETEDQRNWIDASFKTYSTPLRVPFPMRIEEGTRVTQTVTLRLWSPARARRATTTERPAERPGTDPGRNMSAERRGTDPRRYRGATEPRRYRSESGETGEVVLDADTRVQLPSIGLGSASHGAPLDEREAALVRALRPAHLRVDVDLASDSWDERLRAATEDAGRVSAALEIALHGSTDDLERLRGVAALARERQLPVARWLLFDPRAKSTPGALLAEARAVLGGTGAPIVGGTNADFYQLNQARPDAALMDAVTFSVNPQVHAFDALSLVETIAAIPHVLDSARACFPGLPVIVSPVTLRPRFNPVATSGEGGADVGADLPPQVDPRQLSLLGAAWTLGAVVALAEGRASSATIYETTGWRGVMERVDGSPMPALFPSMPGGVFPLYHVLADVAEFAGGTVQPLAPAAGALGRPVACGGVFTNGDRMAVLVANTSPEPQSVRLPDALRGRARRLGIEHATEAACDPAAYREREPRLDEGPLVALSPYEYVRLDC